MMLNGSSGGNAHDHQHTFAREIRAHIRGSGIGPVGSKHGGLLPFQAYMHEAEHIERQFAP